MKLLIIVGARPNFVKIAPLLEQFKKDKKITPVLVHTGQHYDFLMSQAFFEDFKLPKPDYNLGVGSCSQAKQTAKIMLKLETVFLKEKPDKVIVVGDVNSTLAGALTAAKLDIPLAHIEAGMRSYDKTMPEEINRVLTDHLSDFLFVTSELDKSNLLREGIEEKKIFIVGNIMTDTLLKAKLKMKSEERDYAVLTIHRAGNTDKKGNLKEILTAAAEISKKIAVIFPIHPRTQKMIKKFGFVGLIKKCSNFKIIKPLPYLEMINLIKSSKLVMTDSGGLQHETTVLGIPCLTLRDKTEWMITLKQGTNKLTGVSANKIVKEAEKLLNGKSKLKTKIPKYWDGKTSERIAAILKKAHARG